MTHYYEDLTTGDVFETRSEQITKSEMISFAEQFDPQPFHVDEQAAEESIFGELVASGLHSLCLTFRLMVTDVIQVEDGIANMGANGMTEVKWYEPVRPGDELHVRSEVVKKSLPENQSDN